MPDQLVQPSFARKIFRVGFEVVGNILNAFRDERNLHGGGAGVVRTRLEFADDVFSVLHGKYHCIVHLDCNLPTKHSLSQGIPSRRPIFSCFNFLYFVKYNLLYQIKRTKNIRPFFVPFYFIQYSKNQRPVPQKNVRPRGSGRTQGVLVGGLETHVKKRNPNKARRIALYCRFPHRIAYGNL